MTTIEDKKLAESARQFDQDLDLRERELCLENQKFSHTSKRPWFRESLPWLGPTLGAVVAILSIVLSNELESLRAQATSNQENQRLIEQNSAELVLKRYERETQIILQVTQSSNEEINLRNLQFFIEANLIAETPEILSAMEKYGAPTNVGPTQTGQIEISTCESNTRTNLQTVAVNEFRLDGVQYCPTPNKNGLIAASKPLFVVLSYTGNQSADASIAWMLRSEAKASAHLVIRRDGSVAQLGDFNERLWHSGRSSWQGFSGMNNVAIGVMLENAGNLVKSDGGYRDMVGVPLEATASVVEETGVVGPNGTDAWQTYSAEQLETLKNVSRKLQVAYGIPSENFLGFEQVAPDRKAAPGPAFDFDGFRDALQ